MPTVYTVFLVGALALPVFVSLSVVTLDRLPIIFIRVECNIEFHDFQDKMSRVFGSFVFSR